MIVLRWLLIKSTTTIATTLGSNFIRDVAPRSLEAEAYLERSDAPGREKYLKSGAGRRFLRAQLKNYVIGHPSKKAA